MARTYPTIDERLAGWLELQPVFFVATAALAADGSINCSPKGNRGEFAVTAPTAVAYLDQTGSGVETIAQLRENARIVLMFCAFTGSPRIVRLHGRGEVLLPGGERFASLARRFSDPDGTGVRAIIVVNVDRISDSCGYGVPLMSFEAHRSTMDDWARRKGTDGIRAYQSEKNARSIDGLEGLPQPHPGAAEGARPPR